MPPEKIRRLGRGLDALLASTAGAARSDLKFPAREGESGVAGFQRVSVDSIIPNPLQPRRDFNDSELQELRSSIQANGLLQPLLVRPIGASFELVAGERRFRAIRSLGWRDVPVHVRDINDEAVLTLALIENLQRSDLNPIEEAEGYQALVSRFSLTQQQVANAVGRDRSTVANILRLLALPEAVRAMVRSGSLSLGHARALLGLPDQNGMIALADDVIRGGLTVRDIEQRVRESSTSKTRQRVKKAATGHASRPAELRSIEEQLRRRFQTDTSLSVSPTGKGQVSIAFYSADDLERLLGLLLGPERRVE